ncbi:MAG TPA: hypothetical protein VMV50_01500 [Candidatus Paceibacterota bacterium]|nr:hypothetical protein [Candidatus Paceibacterota bacterium]
MLFLASLLPFARPKPKFDTCTLVKVRDEASADELPSSRYLLIVKRRWVKPEGLTRKQWVYDGPIYRVTERGLAYATTGICFLENRLQRF